MYTCRYCDEETDVIGYRETYGVDVTDDGGIDPEYADGGEQWGGEYFCPNCGRELVLGVDVHIE